VKNIRTGTVLVSLGAALFAVAAVPPSTASAAEAVTAFYEMDEAPGTTVMHDSSGNGIDGVVDPTGVESGAQFDGATGYNWVRRPPAVPPVEPQRIVQVPDNPNLEPTNASSFTVEIRFRTKEKFGNIIQKGQSASKGGQWKIENPQGIPTCLFKGSAGRVATGAKTAINDNQWHVLTCVLTKTRVTMYVDGVERSHLNGSAGTVDNAIPMTVGGKINCDQVTVTCDYFSGQIDYVKITKAVNAPPVPSIASSCVARACAFDGSGSSDPDGTVASYAWGFGDGGTSTAIAPSHSYAADGTYDVTLKVTDNQGGTTTTTSSVTVPQGSGSSTIGFDGSAVSVSAARTPTVTVPAGAAVGDRLLLVLSLNSSTVSASAPTGVTGWTQLDRVVSKTMATSVWTKVADAGDPGRAVTVPLSGSGKSTLTVAAYSGVDPAANPVFARAADTVNEAARFTPSVAVPTGAWVVSYWADKSSTTTAWTPEASVAARSAACAASSGRVCSVFADSGPVLAGTNGHVVATTNAASAAATTWSIVLAAAP
jgi:PKD repeat protein